MSTHAVRTTKSSLVNQTPKKSATSEEFLSLFFTLKLRQNCKLKFRKFDTLFRRILFEPWPIQAFPIQRPCPIRKTRGYAHKILKKRTLQIYL